MERVLSPEERSAFAREVEIVGRRWRSVLTERLKTIGMSPARAAALFSLADSPGGLSQVGLADLAGVEGATLVRTIDQLEEAGLVARRPSQTDRRVNLIYLTEAAHPMIAQIQAVADALRLEVMGDVDADQVRAVFEVMRGIRNRLDRLSAPGAV